jgi:riboflavin kinase
MVSLEPVLLALAGRLKSPSGTVSLTTTELGEMLGVSQQTASRYLSELESRGWITRSRAGRGFEVKLTSEGVDVLREIHSGLGRLLHPKVNEMFEGVIVSGMGEGAYYVREYADKIKEAVGYRPYYGTLNVRINGGRPDLRGYRTIKVGGFKSGDRSFGRIELTSVTLTVRGHKIRCHAIVPERTHHEKDLELVSRHNLRRGYDLKDGDKATIVVS